MYSNNNQLFPFKGKITQEAKQKMLGQKAAVLWLTGLSGSGKTTIATHLEELLYSNGYYTKLIDGDNLRSGLNTDLSFGDKDRIENLRRAAEVARLFFNNGIIVICSFITPTEEMRFMVKKIIGQSNYLQIYLKCSLEECEKRDVKGLYKKAREGKIENFTGIGSDFEVPLQSDIEIDTQNLTLEESVKIIYDKIEKIIAE